MANNFRPQWTPKGIEQLLKTLCEADPRIGSVRMDEGFLTESSSSSVYPLVLIEILSAKVEQKAAMTYTRWSVSLTTFDLRRVDHASDSDSFSEGHIALTDILLRMQKEPQIKREWGFLFESAALFKYMRWEGRDDLISVAMEFDFSTPTTLCLGELPVDALPDFSASYGGTPAGSTFLTCASLPNCSVIQTIQADITSLQQSSGGTSFDCSMLWSCPDLLALSAQTAGNAASIVAIQDDVAAVRSDVLELSGFTSSHTDTFVQPGDNIITGGTEYRPIVSTTPTPEFETITAFQGIYSGEVGVNINELFAPSDVLDYLIEGANISIRNNLTGTKSIAVTASPSFNALSASTLTSGTTELSIALSNKFNSVYAPISVVPTYVQPGTNTTTGGTLTRPTVNVIASPAFTKVTADQYVSGTTELGSVFAPISVVPTYVQAGLNVTTGGTITRPTVNVVGSPSFTSVTANNFISGGTNLSSVFAPISVVPTYVQGGNQITTGGTITRPTVNVSSTPSFTSVSATSITATTIILNGIDLSNESTVKITSTPTTTGTSYSDVTGLAFSLEANSTYVVQFSVSWRSSNTAAGLGLSLSVPTSPAQYGAFVISHMNTGTFSRFLQATDDGTASTTVAIANATYIANISANITTTSAGSLQVRFCRGGSAATISVMPGSNGVLRKL